MAKGALSPQIEIRSMIFRLQIQFVYDSRQVMRRAKKLRVKQFFSTDPGYRRA